MALVMWKKKNLKCLPQSEQHISSPSVWFSSQARVSQRANFTHKHKIEAGTQLLIVLHCLLLFPAAPGDKSVLYILEDSCATNKVNWICLKLMEGLCIGG